MGFKKTNYEVKDLGIVIPEAYAVIVDLSISRSRGRATFGVQTSRSACFDHRTLTYTTVNFNYDDRTKNPFEEAYKAGKCNTVDSVTGRTVLAPFADWEDDIVSAEETASADTPTGNAEASAETQAE